MSFRSLGCFREKSRFWLDLNLDVGDTVNHDGKSASPRIQISGSDSLGAQDVHQVTSEGLEEGALNSAGLVAVSHVLNLAEDLQSVVHSGDHVVKTVSDKLNLGVEGGVSGQAVDRDIGERAELLLGARGILEDPLGTIRKLENCV